MKIAKTPGAYQRLQLRSLIFDLVSRPPDVLVTGMTSLTDSEGKSTFPTLPPLDLAANEGIRSSDSAKCRRCEIFPQVTEFIEN